MAAARQTSILSFLQHGKDKKAERPEAVVRVKREEQRKAEEARDKAIKKEDDAAAAVPAPSGTGGGRRFSVRKMLEEAEAEGKEESAPLPLPPEDRSKTENGETETPIGLLEIVWAKYSQYPPWPAIVW